MPNTGRNSWIMEQSALNSWWFWKIRSAKSLHFGSYSSPIRANWDFESSNESFNELKTHFLISNSSHISFTEASLFFDGNLIQAENCQSALCNPNAHPCENAWEAMKRQNSEICNVSKIDNWSIPSIIGSIFIPIFTVICISDTDLHLPYLSLPTDHFEKTANALTLFSSLVSFFRIHLFSF